MHDSLTRLQAFMDEQGLSRKHLAASLGYDGLYLHKVFCGTLPLSDRFIGKFFLVYGPDATAQIFGKPTEKNAPEAVA